MVTQFSCRVCALAKLLTTVARNSKLSYFVCGSARMQRNSFEQVKQNFDVKLSKKLSYILRHGAMKHGLSMKSNGFIPVDELLSKSLHEYRAEDIIRVVENNDKKRFSLCVNNGILEVKANQGHSISNVNELCLKHVEDANFDIIHGTYFNNWDRIKSNGLSRMKRNHIHFAKGLNFICGLRKSADLYIYIDISKATKDGLVFYESENGVILCEGDTQGIIGVKYFSKVTDRHGTILSLT